MMESQKKILLIGERSLSPDGYAYADSFYDIFRGQGYLVESFDPTLVNDVFGRVRRTDLSFPEQIAFDYWINKKLVKAAITFRPDVCFVLKGDTIHPRTIVQIKKNTGARWILLFPDNPFMFSNGNSNALVVRALEFCDVVLSWAQMLIPVFTSLGVKHVCYFPFGYDELFFSKDEAIESCVDVGFVGTADQERADLLSLLLQKKPDLKLGIWGNRWDEFAKNNTLILRVFRGPAVYKESMVRLLRSCKIVLNPVRLQNYTSHNMRSLEAAAAGAFQLATRTKEHAHVLFKEDESIVLYEGVDELSEKIEKYLSDFEARKNIALNGNQVARTYALQAMLQRFFDNDLCFCSTLL